MVNFGKNISRRHKKVVDLSAYRDLVEPPVKKEVEQKIKLEFKHSLSVGVCTRFFDGEKLVLGKIVGLEPANKTYRIQDGQGFFHICSSDPLHICKENKSFLKAICSTAGKKANGYRGVDYR